MGIVVTLTVEQIPMSLLVKEQGRRFSRQNTFEMKKSRMP
jgi:hypothetical protein